jgi:hypothetical protein
VRLAALTVLLIGNVLASQVHAEEISTQPLTRADCHRARMTWNDTAKVCAAAQGLEAFVEALFAKRAMSAGAGNQPLTRNDCDSGGMTWNDAANVCGVAAQAAEAMSEPQDAQPQDAQPMPPPEVTDTAGQPLTREDCDNAGMPWDDTGNVCGTASPAAEEMPEAQEPVTETASEATNPVESINIDKASQKMTVLLDGVQQYKWPVSTGLRGYTIHRELTLPDR